MQNWREIFGSIETHSAISLMVKENVYSYVLAIFKSGVIGNKELIEFDEKSKEQNTLDISEVKELLFYKFPTTSSVSIGIFKSLQNKGDKNRFHEFELVVRQLVIFRNHWSHQVHHEETGWSVLFSGLLLRLLELNISEKVSKESIEKIRVAAQKLLSKSIYDDPHDYQKPLPEAFVQYSSSEPVWLNEVKEIQDLSAQIALHKDTMAKFRVTATLI